MATYKPDPVLFQRQIDSLRTQTEPDWVCYLQDDASGPDTEALLSALAEEDPRFLVAQNPENLGFYRNFEASLSRVPETIPFVVLADQDDVWYPEKIEVLLAEFSKETQLVYSDCRIVDAHGKVLSETFWTRKKNQWDDLETLVLANTVTGAASALRRELLTVALPFPYKPGPKLYHDHWLAIVAGATGTLRYVDRPLYDYVQHEGADTGHFEAKKNATAAPRKKRNVRLRETIEQEDTIRVLFLQTLLERGSLNPQVRERLLALKDAGPGVWAHLSWLLDRVRRGYWKTPGFRLLLRRIEAKIRGV